MTQNLENFLTTDEYGLTQISVFIRVHPWLIKLSKALRAAFWRDSFAPLRLRDSTFSHTCSVGMSR